MKVTRNTYKLNEFRTLYLATFKKVHYYYFSFCLTGLFFQKLLQVRLDSNRSSTEEPYGFANVTFTV